MRLTSLKSLALVALTVLALAFVLTGCGSSSSSSSNHSSEWTSQDVTEFVAEIQGQFQSELPSLATSEVGKKIIACALDKVKPTYSPKTIGEEKYKPALEEIGRNCAEKYKAEVGAAVKKEAEEKQAGGSGGTGATGESETESEGGATGTTEEETGTESH